nr:ribonuclease M5 [Ileibacterium valens]
MMKKIKEMIVVEGKNDTSKLKTFFDCDTIETGGDHVSKEVLDRIEAAANRRGIIVFTDPDTAGEHIRRLIKERIPEAKHAFIAKSKAKTDKKVGVEHAGKEDLEKALKSCVTFMEGNSTLSREDFLDLGLTGDALRRQKVTEAFHLGKCNAKTAFKRLNEAGITREQIEEVLE